MMKLTDSVKYTAFSYTFYITFDENNRLKSFLVKGFKIDGLEAWINLVLAKESKYEPTFGEKLIGMIDRGEGCASQGFSFFRTKISELSSNTVFSEFQNEWKKASRQLSSEFVWVGNLSWIPDPTIVPDEWLKQILSWFLEMKKTGKVFEPNF